MDFSRMSTRTQEVVNKAMESVRVAKERELKKKGEWSMEWVGNNDSYCIK